MLEVLFDDTAPEPALEDERQEQTEVDGRWPEKVNLSQG